MKSREPETTSPHPDLETRVLRRLRGELGAAEAAALAAELLTDPVKAGIAEGLERTWQNLELPPCHLEPVAPLLMARLRGEELRWSLAPTWARAAASLALVAGLGLGFVLGGGGDSGEGGERDIRDISDIRDSDSGDTDDTGADLDLFSQAEESGFAESFWLAAEGVAAEETP